jgi:starch synthase
MRAAGTGFLFEDFSASSLRECLRGALCAYREKTGWRALARRGMGVDFSWTASACKYLELFRRVRGAYK